MRSPREWEEIGKVEEPSTEPFQLDWFGNEKEPASKTESRHWGCRRKPRDFVPEDKWKKSISKGGHSYWIKQRIEIQPLHLATGRLFMPLVISISVDWWQ